MYYDPLGRVVKTVNADNSEQLVVYGVPAALNAPSNFTPSPWENYAYDANDLAPLTNPTGSNVPASHYYTPKSSEVDALGRTIKTTEFFDNTNYANTIDMNYRYDVRGNLLDVKDPYNRTVFEHVYDLRTPQKDQPLPPLKTVHIDKGISRILFDVTGKPIESNDAKGAQALSAYDVISRPTHSWAKNKTGDTITLRNYLLYGEGATTPSTFNLNGKSYQSYDEAGFVETPVFDFKGNMLTKNRQVISSATLKAQLDTYTTFIVDWTGLPSILDSFVFETNMEYDALNRITKLTLPLDLETDRREIIPGYNSAGALEKVELKDASTTTTYVENIAYNAKGQRLMIAFGNDVMTRYAYDPITFRLLRQRSEKYTKTQVGNTITYAYSSGTTKQDDGFNFDLIGNIVKILTRVTDCGISTGALGSNALDREFEYDPIYRLTYADGRESNTQSGNNYLYDDAPAPGSPNASNVRFYSRTYDYDKLGNIQNVIQGGTNGFTRTFDYNTGVNTLQQVVDGSSVLIEDFTYDANGNQITASSNRFYVWNHADQLICYKNKVGAADPTVYTQYDYSGQDRVSKLVRTGTSSMPIYERTIYIDGVFEYVKLETGTTYEKNYIHIMDDKSRIAEVRINPGTAFPGDISDDITYVIENQIGSSVMRTNTSGTEIDKEEYYPFGDSSLRTFTYKRYRYVGKERDAESGLYYYGARYYAAWTCRFISVDPLAEHYMYLTPYNYANNNPINDFDIDGMQDTQSTTDSAKPYGPPTQQEMEQQKQNAKPGLPKVNGVTGPFSLSYIENTNSNQTSVTEAQKPDYSFSKEKINNLGNVYDEAKKTTGKQNPDCWEIYRQVASTLTGDKDVLKQSGQNMKLTNYMKDNNYFVNTQGQTFSYNSSRSGDANNGYKGNATSLIESNLNDQKDGSYVFALQVAFQHHNITIIAEKTGETYTYQAFDQGTGWFNETPEKMSAETLNKQVIKVYEHRFTEFGGQGKEISSRLYWYNGSTAK